MKVVGVVRMASKRAAEAAAFVAKYLKKGGKEKTYRLAKHNPQERLVQGLPEVASRVLPAELLHALHLRNATPRKGEARAVYHNKMKATAREAQASWRFTHPEKEGDKRDA